MKTSLLTIFLLGYFGCYAQKVVYGLYDKPQYTSYYSETNREEVMVPFYTLFPEFELKFNQSGVPAHVLMTFGWSSASVITSKNLKRLVGLDGAFSQSSLGPTPLTGSFWIKADLYVDNQIHQPDVEMSFHNVIDFVPQKQEIGLLKIDPLHLEKDFKNAYWWPIYKAETKEEAQNAQEELAGKIQVKNLRLVRSKMNIEIHYRNYLNKIDGIKRDKYLTKANDLELRGDIQGAMNVLNEARDSLVDIVRVNEKIALLKSSENKEPAKENKPRSSSDNFWSVSTSQTENSNNTKQVTEIVSGSNSSTNYQTGKKHLESKDFAKAEKYLQSAYDSDPSNAQYKQTLAKAKYENRRMQVSKGLFEQSMKNLNEGMIDQRSVDQLSTQVYGLVSGISRDIADAKARREEAELERRDKVRRVMAEEERKTRVANKKDIFMTSLKDHKIPLLSSKKEVFVFIVNDEGNDAISFSIFNLFANSRNELPYKSELLEKYKTKTNQDRTWLYGPYSTIAEAEIEISRLVDFAISNYIEIMEDVPFTLLSSKISLSDSQPQKQSGSFWGVQKKQENEDDQ